MALCEDDIEEDFIKIEISSCNWNHFSIKTVSAFKAMKIAKKFNKEVILDIDYRPNLGNGQAMKEKVASRKIFSHKSYPKYSFYCTLIIGMKKNGISQVIKMIL